MTLGRPADGAQGGLTVAVSCRLQVYNLSQNVQEDDLQHLQVSAAGNLRAGPVLLVPLVPHFSYCRHLLVNVRSL